VDHPITDEFWNSRNCCKEQIRQYQKAWRNKNPGYTAKAQAKYYEANKQKCIASNYRYASKRRLVDPDFKLAHMLRQRISKALKQGWKAGSAVADLGCSVAELRLYLESKFQTGMSWENYGKRGWHIDHIQPLSSFDLTDPEQFKVAVHFSNLQPLWAEENYRKSNKWSAEISA
jgi:hypothetical protein